MAFVLPARLPSPCFAAMRIQEPPHLHLLSRPNNPSPQRRRKGKQVRWEYDAIHPVAAAPRDLEAEIYEFMQRSANPGSFPTRDELIAADRADLAQAIATEGGWLAFGWDLDDHDGSAIEDGGVSQERLGSCSSPAESTVASSSGREIEVEVADDAGIEGILSRLEMERSGWSSAAGLRDKGVNGRGSHRSIERDLDDGNIKVPAPDMWRTWSLQRSGFPATEFEAAEIVPDESRKQPKDPIHEATIDDGAREVSQSTDIGTKWILPYSDAKKGGKNQIRLRLQQLESELSSVLSLLKPKSNAGVPQQGRESSVEELHRLSDALEFQETEIMNARDKLRSTRAKLAVLEGKMTLEIIEAQKILEDKRKRLDSAQETLQLLRTVRVIWPNSASEVLLVGSFDGWTSQRRMEMSSTGFFSLHLKLYPGRYEIKFIVDGVWTVDPLRPIVNNNGHENNLLIIP